MRAIMKTIFVIAGLSLAAAGLCTPAQAQNYPWCAQYGRGTGGAMNCGFANYQQCMADVSGIGGFCEPNNTYRPQAARHRRRAQP